MHSTKTFWPSAHNFAESMQCPAICFRDPSLRSMVPAVDRLGMPLVTSGQFAYVFKLNGNEHASSLAVRCFRGFLGDREQRYTAIDSHLAANYISALPRFKYLPDGILVAGELFPVLIMQWIEGPTLDVYLEEAVGQQEIMAHLAEEWLRVVSELRTAGVAHGDLQHGNIIVDRGRMRLVDLDGMFVPTLSGIKSSEIGHQHYQHPLRDAAFFNESVDNFSALVIYLSLIALTERPELWREHHDENLLFTRGDFVDPSASTLFAKLRETGGEAGRLAEILRTSVESDPSTVPSLSEIVESNSVAPVWMPVPPKLETAGRTREVQRSEVFGMDEAQFRTPRATKQAPATLRSASVQTLFGAPPVQTVSTLDPSNITANMLWFAKTAAGDTYAWLWWIPVHNFLLSNLWLVFDISGFFSIVLTCLLLVVGFLVYGIMRAVHLEQTSQPPPLSGTIPTAPLYASSTSSPANRLPTGIGNIFGSSPIATVMPVIGNRGLMIYHLPGCTWIDKIPARQRDDFMSPDLARNAGFRACHVCAP